MAIDTGVFTGVAKLPDGTRGSMLDARFNANADGGSYGVLSAPV